MRTTLSVGFDAVVPIDPTIYHPTEDAAGRAYAFDMADAREDVVDVVRAAVDPSGAVDAVEVTPGYVGVRLAPSDPIKPKALVDALRSVPDEYNRRYATAPDLDGLAFDRGHYLGTYHPEDRPTEEAFLDRYASGETVPESDGPVFTHRRDDAGEDALQSNRRLWYRVVLPFDPQMYNQSETLGVAGDPPVRWDRDAVQTALQVTVEDLPPWPGRPENTPLIAVYPGYLLVEYATASITVNPERLGERIGSAFTRYNGPVEILRG